MHFSYTFTWIPIFLYVVPFFFPLPPYFHSVNQDYIHRVGRTARAGRAGRAVTFVTQYDVELFQRIEELLGYKLEAYPCVEAEVRWYENVWG